MVRCCLLYILLAMLSGCSLMMLPKANSGEAGQIDIWPFINAPEYLQKTKEMEIADVYDKENKPAQFAVFQEYTSAGGKLCKKYYVNTDYYLACYDSEWRPVRFFGE